MNGVLCDVAKITGAKRLFDWYPSRIDPLSFGPVLQKKYNVFTKTLAVLGVSIHLNNNNSWDVGPRGEGKDFFINLVPGCTAPDPGCTAPNPGCTDQSF